jgi:hypothetical protein
MERLKRHNVANIQNEQYFPQNDDYFPGERHKGRYSFYQLLHGESTVLQGSILRNLDFIEFRKVERGVHDSKEKECW